MKLRTRILDDIKREIIEVWDSEKQEIWKYVKVTSDYPETHHIDYLEEKKDGAKTKEEKDEAEKTAETPWAAAEISCKSCLSTCCGFGQKPRRVG